MIKPSKLIKKTDQKSERENSNKWFNTKIRLINTVSLVDIDINHMKNLVLDLKTTMEENRTIKRIEDKNFCYKQK